MPTDLRELLESAAAAPPAFDADAIVDRGLRQRRVRTWGRAGAVALVLTLVAGAILLSLPRNRVDLVGPGAAPAWPLALRYQFELVEGGQSRTLVGEVAAAGWNNWIHVTRMLRDPAWKGPQPRPEVTRWTADDSFYHGEVRANRAGEPFGLLEAAAASPLRYDDSQSAMDEAAPNALLNPRFGQEPEPRTDRRILAEDLPRLRQQVADRLSLNPAALDSVRYEHNAFDISGGIQRHTFVWIPELQLPLYVEEVDPNGDRFTLTVTHLREGIAPPPAPQG